MIPVTGGTRIYAGARTFNFVILQQERGHLIAVYCTSTTTRNPRSRQ
jgi:hypothetical protein